MIRFSLICHEKRINVQPKLTGGVTVVHHDPEGWNNVQRMWRRSVTEWQGAPGLELQIPFIFDQWGHNPATGKYHMSIEKELRQLETLTMFDRDLARTPIFRIDGNGAIPYDYTRDHTKMWVCGGIELADDYILNRQQHRCRQSGTFTAFEWIPTQIVQAKTVLPTQRIPKTYRVKKGDTLIKIAVHFYGDGSKWRHIAQLNKLKSPYHLKVGRVLKL